MKRIEVIREVDRLDGLVVELGNHIAYGEAMSEDLTLELDHLGEPAEALTGLQERRFELSELLRRNPGQQEFDI